MLHGDLKLCPYKVHLLQEQSEANKTKRLEFARKTFRRIENNPDLLSLILFSDEVHFHLTGHVKRQNFRYVSSEQQHDYQERPLSVEKTTVWCAVGRNGIFGPYFFEDENHDRITVNPTPHIDMLRRHFIPDIRRRRGNALPYSSRTELHYAQNNRWIISVSIFQVTD